MSTTMPSAGTSTALYMAQKKSMLLGFVLTFFLGPLGMLYSTVIGATVIFFLTALAILLTGGIGLLVVWPVSLVWTVFAIKRKNTRLAAGLA